VSVHWLQPIAWLGLAALAVPIVIHLLSRRQTRRVPFPSLKFLPTARIATLRHRALSDWPLLALRLATLGCATAALAAPVIVSSGRQEAWNARTVRGVVVAPDPSGRTPADSGTGDLVEDARRGSHASAVFTPRVTVADGLRDAADWLSRQGPAAREVVVVGDLRAGALTTRDFDALTPATGVRLLPRAVSADRSALRLGGIADAGDGSLVPADLHTTLEHLATRVEYRATGAHVTPVTVRAAPGLQPAADAALRAVLLEGVRLPRDTARRVEIVLADGRDGRRVAGSTPVTGVWMRRALEQLPGVDGAERDGALVVTAEIAADDSRAVHLIARVIAAAFADELDALEPRPISAEMLSAWSRPPRPLEQEVGPADEGDRRIFWAAVLALLAIEHSVRRRRPTSATQDDRAAVRDAEVRVA
jgi:hypothetical protein